MTLPWLIATLHLLALAIGSAGVFLRGRALKTAKDQNDVPAILRADDLWGLAGLLWLVTGVWRAFFGIEKGTEYYMENPLFHVKLGLFLLLLGIEMVPVWTLVGWRLKRRRGEPVDLSKARSLARISHIEFGIVVIIVFLATAIARGIRP